MLPSVARARCVVTLRTRIPDFVLRRRSGVPSSRRSGGGAAERRARNVAFRCASGCGLGGDSSTVRAQPRMRSWWRMRAQPLLVAESAERVQEEGARDAATPAVLQLDVVKPFKRSLSTGRVATCTPRPRPHHSQLLLAMRRARRHLPLRPLPRPPPAGCLSVVDSRICAGPGATCPSPSARFPARRRLRLPACLGRARQYELNELESPERANIQLLTHAAALAGVDSQCIQLLKETGRRLEPDDLRPPAVLGIKRILVHYGATPSSNETAPALDAEEIHADPDVSRIYDVVATDINVEVALSELIDNSLEATKAKSQRTIEVRIDEAARTIEISDDA
eukprot:tig00000821_g4494.t1